MAWTSSANSWAGWVLAISEACSNKVLRPTGTATATYPMTASTTVLIVARNSHPTMSDRVRFRASNRQFSSGDALQGVEAEHETAFAQPSLEPNLAEFASYHGWLKLQVSLTLEGRHIYSPRGMKVAMPSLIRGTLLFALLATGAASSVNAQGTQGETGGVQKQVQLSSAQQVAAGEGALRRASSLAERLSKMLDGARRDKDILKADCLNRKLTEVNASTRNIESRIKALNDAVKGNDKNRANHEFTVLSVVGQKLDQLEQEASQCLGQDSYESGASQVVTIVPEDDPTGVNAATASPPPPAPPSVTVPPPLSPAK